MRSPGPAEAARPAPLLALVPPVVPLLALATLALALPALVPVAVAPLALVPVAVAPPALVPVAAREGDLPVRVCVSVLPQAFLVDRVGGDRVAVISLTKAGQSPHMFEPTPVLVAALASSRVCFSIGLPFEETVLRDVKRVNPGLIVVDSAVGVYRHGTGGPEETAGSDEQAGPASAESGYDAHVESTRRPESPPGGGHSHDESSDPHVWLSPKAAAVIAANVRDGLVSVDPAGAHDYDSNLTALLEELDRLDGELEALLGPFAGENFYVFHPAFGYFAEAYGLRQVAIEIDGKEPGARDLAAVVSKARAEGVRTIFVQPQHPSGIAETVAREIGAELVTLDPLAYDYADNLRETGRAIAWALSREGAERDDDDTGQ
ncbi:MAG: zinc ABC transporter substrate-binding protein [Candidatus Eisenbacteria bacterium]